MNFEKIVERLAERRNNSAKARKEIQALIDKVNELNLDGVGILTNCTGISYEDEGGYEYKYYWAIKNREFGLYYFCNIADDFSRYAEKKNVNELFLDRLRYQKLSTSLKSFCETLENIDTLENL